MDWTLVAGGAIVGMIVGMTGMGGGALMTPMLVLFFGVQPLAAVSNDLVVTAFMKPVGGAVHLRRGTVHLDLVKWLMVGSVPAAFGGVLILRFLLGDSTTIQEVIKLALGAALLLAAFGIAARAYVSARGEGGTQQHDSAPSVIVRRRATVIVGAVAGLVVGLTSVGSGSLVVVALLTLYPALSAARLVGTDIVQAIPLVASAALAHVLFGDFHLDLAAALLLGSIPGVWVGAHTSSRAPDGIVKSLLAVVLTASALKMFGVPTAGVGWFLLGVAVAGSIAWVLVRTTAARRSARPADPEPTSRVTAARH
jgi:uncharacterized protein